MDHLKMKQTLMRNNRILAYCTLIVICSVLSLPEDYKIDKRNVLNQWFVKLGWFWTTTLLLPVLFLTIRVDDRDAVFQTILRLVTSSILWYTSVNLFQYLDTNTGFDISGHTFLLAFSNLIITSELELVEVSDKLEKFTNKKSIPKKEECCRTQHFFTVKLILLTLTVLWDFMLLQTALYYHTILQKAIAMAWAVGSWYILHVFFYHKPKLELETLGRGDRCASEHISVKS